MSKTNVLNLSGEKVSDITLNKEIFGITPNDAVLYDAIKLAQNNSRQGTADVKSRSEVSGGGRKPWRQKGTGRARQGSIRAPHWYHGGVAFGPTPRSYATKMNKKERRLALKSALTYKVLNKELIIVDNFNVETNKTKDMVNILKSFEINRNALIVVDELTDNIVLATRNIKNVLLLSADEINTLDVVSADKMIVTVDAIKKIEEALA
jgi:large subunit ribosomal protein L4